MREDFCKCRTDYGDGAAGLSHVEICDDLAGVDPSILLLDVCHYEVWILEGVPEIEFPTVLVNALIQRLDSSQHNLCSAVDT